MKQNTLKRILWLCFFTVCSSSQLFTQNLSTLKEQQPISLHGSLSVSTAFNQIEGIDRRQPPVSYVISGNPVLRIYGVDLPFGFMFSNYQRNFSQPFNKFGVSPRYKEYTLHLGYRNINFSPFTLSGRTFFGVGLEGNPGLIRFGFVYGRFQKAVEELNNFLDGEMDRALLPSYKRMAYSIKMGIGNDDNYLDFIILKGKDDPLSLIGVDLKPEENAALGVSARMTLMKNLVFTGDFGTSVYTRDITEATVPIGVLNIPEFTSSLITPRITSQVGFAGMGKLTWTGKGYSLNATYRRIDPGYKTMGAFYFQTDVEQYLGGFALSSKDNQWMMKADLGWETDNIKENRLTQTSRTIGQAYASWQPKPNAGISVQYSNFGITQTPGLKSISDTTLLRNINQNLVIQPRYLIQGKQFSHLINGMFNYADLSDKSDETTSLTQVRSVTGQATYSLTWVQAALSLTGGYNQINSTLALGQTRSGGWILGLSKSLLNNSMQLSLNYTHQSNTFEGEAYGSTTRLMGSVQYRLQKNHQFRLQLYRLVNNSDQSALSKSFTESVLRITYTYRFNTLRK